MSVREPFVLKKEPSVGDLDPEVFFVLPPAGESTEERSGTFDEKSVIVLMDPYSMDQSVEDPEEPLSQKGLFILDVCFQGGTSFLVDELPQPFDRQA